MRGRRFLTLVVVPALAALVVPPAGWIPAPWSLMAFAEALSPGTPIPHRLIGAPFLVGFWLSVLADDLRYRPRAAFWLLLASLTGYVASIVLAVITWAEPRLLPLTLATGLPFVCAALASLFVSGQAETSKP